VSTVESREPAPHLAPTRSRTVVDSAGHRRKDETWLAEAWQDPRTRVLVLQSGEGTNETGYRAMKARQCRALVTDDSELVLVRPDQAPPGDRYLLGVEPAADGGEIVYFAVKAEPGYLLPETAASRACNLRDVGALLGDRDAGLLTHAVSLANYHLTHRFCPTCGSPTVIGAAGHVRVCEREGSEMFPRTDPAVIMLVHGTVDGVEKCLLAHNPQWPDPRRHSVLAGFVEAGESLEQAVIREVAEEVGVAVSAPTYMGSQPWPFPRSLMLGYTAQAVGEAQRTDHSEIAAMRWLSRDELRAATESGDVLLPGHVSIARKLIEHWQGEHLPGDW
jgi:NAD+ diphosphatase